MPYIFDGYNVYHIAYKLRADWAHITPYHLCEIIGRDMQRMADHATVVFDGVQPRGWSTEVEPRKHVRIVYSGAKNDADSLIETLIRKNTAPKRLTVVSSDNRIRQAARRRKAVSQTGREYLDELSKREIPKTPRPQMPEEKKKGVPEGELEEWLDLFGIDPEDEGDEDIGRISF